MVKTKRIISIAIVGLIIFIFNRFFSNSSYLTSLSRPPEKTSLSVTPEPTILTASISEANLVKVSRVIDGDTIELINGEKVRYIGIDTAELNASKKSECFAEEAFTKNRELVEGKEVKLEKDVSETDKYGRLLRYVYLGNEMINEKLVKEGYAQVATYPPDVKYVEKFKEAQKFARENNLGLWKDCK